MPNNLRTFTTDILEDDFLRVREFRHELNVGWGNPMVYSISYRVLNKIDEPRCVTVRFRNFSGRDRADNRYVLAQPGQEVSGVASLYSNMDGGYRTDPVGYSWRPINASCASGPP